jgi:hypothetical protein
MRPSRPITIFFVAFLSATTEGSGEFHHVSWAQILSRFAANGTTNAGYAFDQCHYTTVLLDCKNKGLIRGFVNTVSPYFCSKDDQQWRLQLPGLNLGSIPLIITNSIFSAMKRKRLRSLID